MAQMTVNTSDYEIRRSREAVIGWASSLDAKRPTAWAQYGYPSEVTFPSLLTAYSRGGAGQGAVHRLLDKCWQVRPRIKAKSSDTEGPWEKSVATLLDGLFAWQKLRDFDRRNMVGRYAGLIYRMADGKALDQPLERAARLVDLVPVYENQIEVVRWHADPADSDNFGKPAMWAYRARRPEAANTQARPDMQVNVHPSRVQILAEGSCGDFLEGVPLLLAGFNSLIDLEKIGGGSAEAFLKNSARAVTINFDPTASPQVITQNPDGSASGKTVREVIGEQVDNLNRSIDSALVTQGAEAGTLQTTVSDPKPSFEVAANLFAASVRLPFTILFGQQTGRLASDEDKADFIARAVSRQANELTPMLTEFVQRMQAAGVIPDGEFEIEWPPLDAPGDDAKFDQVGKLATAMKSAFDAGLTEPLFDANELRGVAGFEERADDGMPTEEDRAAADAAQAAADAAAAGMKQPAPK